jgi:large subunit ribosomal protein L32
MAVPKKKISTSRRGMRRSHDALLRTTIVECSNCGAEKLPHHVCPSCGFYDKKKVVSIKKSLDDSKE